jgi:hypothetical protein
VAIRRDQVAIKGRRSWARTGNQGLTVNVFFAVWIAIKGNQGQSRAIKCNQGLTVNVFFADWMAKLSNPTVGQSRAIKGNQGQSQ